MCLVMYSSGTTGRPKGVMLTHANMVAHTRNAHDGWAFEPGDKSMVSMPLFHVGGSSYVLFGIHDGIPSVMTRDPDGASLAGAILAGANRTFLVPAVLAQVLQAGPDAVKLFGALRTYTYGAAPMPLPLLRAAMEAWPDTDFIQVYGLTEVAGVATHLMPEAHHDAAHPERLTSAGQPIPECEVRIVDPGTLEDLPVGEHGEIWLRTPQLMKGFLGKPEETAAVITEDGWFRTGDMGSVDDEGFVFVEDRLKDMIISGGENIYSPEIERVLAEHPAVMEVAIIGVPDDTWGESVKAVVALKPGASASEEELIEHCRAHLARFKCPGRWTSSRPSRATPPARSSSASCASPTGPATTAPPSEADRAVVGTPHAVPAGQATGRACHNCPVGPWRCRTTCPVSTSAVPTSARSGVQRGRPRARRSARRVAASVKSRASMPASAAAATLSGRSSTKTSAAGGRPARRATSS